jgi:hypothetical protein
MTPSALLAISATFNVARTKAFKLIKMVSIEWFADSKDLPLAMNFPALAGYRPSLQHAP